MDMGNTFEVLWKDAGVVFFYFFFDLFVLINLS